MKKNFLYLSSLIAGFALAIGIATAALAEEFYRGKTIRIICPWDPGASPDTAARLYARHLPRFIPGNPRIIVQNMIGAGGVVATNYLYNVSKPDGFTLGITEPPVILTQLGKIPGVKYEMEGFQYIGAVEQQSQLVIIRGELPYATLEKARKAKEPLVIGVRRIGSSDYVGARAVQALGVPIRIVTGYSTPAQFMAIQRGEVDLLVTSFSTLVTREPSWTKPGGPVHWIVSIGNARPEVASIPNIRDLTPLSGEEGIVKIADFLGKAPRRLLIFPPGVNKELLETLRASFARMVQDEKFLAEAKRLKFRVAPLVGNEVQQSIEQFATDRIVQENVGNLIKK